ncbi:MAG: hypothetical protein AAFZ63_21620 [Bacteroidota bacterium]
MKRFIYILFLLGLFSLSANVQSCSRKSGCPAYETTKVKTKRNGSLSNRKGSSQLFPKKMRRKNKRSR